MKNESFEKTWSDTLNLIHAIMAENALSKSGLAHMMGKSPANVHQMLNPNKGNPCLSTLVEIANALGKNVTIQLTDKE